MTRGILEVRDKIESRKRQVDDSHKAGIIEAVEINAEVQRLFRIRWADNSVSEGIRTNSVQSRLNDQQIWEELPDQMDPSEPDDDPRGRIWNIILKR